MKGKSILTFLLFCFFINSWAATQPPPAAPVLTSPTFAKTGVGTRPATLTWIASTGDYTLQIATNIQFTGATTYYNATNPSSMALNYNTHYFWRVRVTVSGVPSAWSSFWNFTTNSASSSSPTLISPKNNQTGVNLYPTLEWNGVSGVSSYTVQVSTDASFTNNIVNKTINSPTYSYTITASLTPDVIYFWRVSTSSQKSATWHFTAERMKAVFWPSDDYSKRDLVEYFHKLNYNYILYSIPFVDIMSSLASNGTDWVFNNQNYTTGNAVNDFVTFRNYVQSKGMHVIPTIGSLSHMDVWINGWPDAGWPAHPELSEFTDFCTWGANHGLFNSSNPCDPLKNSVFNANPAAGTPAAKLITAIFSEQLKIFQSNWTDNSLYPQYIHIGHDEIGQRTLNLNNDCSPTPFLCFVGQDQSTIPNSGWTQSHLLANEINTRCNEAFNIVSPFTKICLYGDSFLPLDNGDDCNCGLIGDNGQEGVLSYMNSFGLANKCIIMPWNYSDIDGLTKCDEARPFYKLTQLQYIEQMGFKYAATAGEASDGGCDITDGWSGLVNVMNKIQVTYEWVRATQFCPKNLVGFCLALYNNADCCNADTCTGYTGAALAYYAWTYGEQSLQIPRYDSFMPRVYSKLHAVQSCKDLNWVDGIHYSRPSKTGVLQTMTGSIKY